MRKLTYGMNVTLDGYIAAPGDDIGWGGSSDELFQWWLDQERAIGLFLYGRKLWETMSSHWPTGDQQPGATPAQWHTVLRRAGELGRPEPGSDADVSRRGGPEQVRDEALTSRPTGRSASPGRRGG